MKFVWSILLIILLCSPVYGNMHDDMNVIQDKLSKYTSSSKSKLIVFGKFATTAEKLEFKFAQEKNPKLNKVSIVNESEDLSLNQSIIYLVGGPTQNEISAKIKSEYEPTEQHDVSFGIIETYNVSNQTFIILSDAQGYKNNPKAGVYKSPLAKIVPPEAVPLAATVATVSLMWLWHLLFLLLKKIGSFKLASKIKKYNKKRKLKKEFLGFNIFGIRIKLREWLAIAASATIFAAAASYVYIFKQHLFSFIALGIVINLLIYTVRNGVRLYLDKHHNIHTEYVIWYWGALLTVVSGWLGNTFSLAGYMISDAERTEKKKKTEGHVAFLVNLITFIVFIITALWNHFAPNTIIQRIMMLSIGITFLFMLPFKPFSGIYVYAWKKWLWWVFFIPLLVCYVAVNIIV